MAEARSALEAMNDEENADLLLAISELQRLLKATGLTTLDCEAVQRAIGLLATRLRI